MHFYIEKEKNVVLNHSAVVTKKKIENLGAYRKTARVQRCYLHKLNIAVAQNPASVFEAFTNNWWVLSNANHSSMHQLMGRNIAVTLDDTWTSLYEYITQMLK